jgi:membrane protease subunit HflK
MGHSKKLEYTALVGLVLQLIFAGTCMVVAGQSNSRAATAETYQLAIGLLVWFVVLVHGRQKRLAREEHEEMQRLRESRLSEEIFEESELDTLRASAGLRVFERYVVPGITLVLSALLLYFGWRVASEAWGAPMPTVDKPSMVAVAAIFVAFAGFLIGRYAAGLAQEEGYGLLRAAGGYVLGNVIGLILIAISMALLYFDVAWAEVAVTFAIPVIMGLVGVELVLNLILDIYRPRVPGQERRPPYDSRILGLFAEPQGVFKTVAATLDYQFGFKVSDTWFYHFMERAIVPLVMVEVVSLWLLTSIVVVDPGEVVFVETFSRPYLTQEDAAKGLQATLLEPGFHTKLPWPFGIARHVPAYQVQSIDVGWELKENVKVAHDVNLAHHDDVVLWNEFHIPPAQGEEVSFIVPSASSGASTAAPAANTALAVAPTGSAEPASAAPAPDASSPDLGSGQAAPEVNLARLHAYVDYRVKLRADGTVDPQAAFTYTFRQADIQRHMEKLAYQELCRIAASQDFIRWVAQDRQATAERLKQMLQAAADEQGLGLEVTFVGIPAVHPPLETATAYERVVTAMEDKETLAYQGRQAAEQTVWRAKGARQATVSSARGLRVQLVKNAEASQRQFLKQLDAYKRAPLVYMFRSYFDTMEQVLRGQKLYLVPETKDEVITIDTKAKLEANLLQFSSGGE